MKHQPRHTINFMKRKDKKYENLRVHSPATGDGFFITHHLGFHCKRMKKIYTLLRWFKVINATSERIKYLFPVSVLYISFHNRAHFSHVYPCFDPVDLNVTLLLIGYPMYQDNPEYNRVLFGVLFCLTI